MESSLKRKLPSSDNASSSENASSDNESSSENASSDDESLSENASSYSSADVINNSEDPLERLRICDYQTNQSETGRGEHQIMLDASVSVCRFLLKGGLPYRCDEFFDHSLCQGLFLETLKLIEQYNEALHEVMVQEALVINELGYPTIQKEIVSCFAKEIRKFIFDEIGTDVFSLSVDKFEMSCTDQMAVVLRYVDARGLVKERFVGCVQLTESSDSTLKSVLDTFLSENQVSLKQVRGQSYYGASDMRDEFNCLRSLILKENSSAYYGNCFAHQLQSVVVAVAEKHNGVGHFYYMLDNTMNAVSTSCKQKDTILESLKDKVQKAFGKGESENDRGLNQVEDTHWDFHHKTIISLISLFPDIVKVLEYVEEEGVNCISLSHASRVLDYFETFDFVFCLHLMLHVLGLTSVLARVLQRKDQSILETVSLVKATKQSLQKFKENGFGPLLEKCESFCQEHNLKTLKMEEAYVSDRNRKKNITNQQYFEVDVFNTFLDMQIQEFGDRFNEVNMELLDNMSALSPRASFPNVNFKYFNLVFFDCWSTCMR